MEDGVFYRALRVVRAHATLTSGSCGRVARAGIFFIKLCYSWNCVTLHRRPGSLRFHVRNQAQSVLPTFSRGRFDSLSYFSTESVNCCFPLCCVVVNVLDVTKVRSDTTFSKHILRACNQTDEPDKYPDFGKVII